LAAPKPFLLQQGKAMQLVLIIDESPRSSTGAAKLSRVVHWIRSGQTLVVGRDRQRADVRIETDARMSGAHFQVSCLPTGCRLQDLDSRHGTLINGVRVTETELHGGDRIQAGETTFRVEISGSPAPPNPATAPRAVADPEQPTLKILRKDLVADEAPGDVVSNVAGASAQVGEVVDAEQLAGEAAAGQAAAEDVGETPAHDQRMQIVLQVIEGPWGGGKYPSLDRLMTWIRPGETVTVGRSHTRADMAIHRDREMSGAHFELACDGSYCRLRDLESTNGTYLNGQRVAAAILRDGDEIRAGRTNFVVAVDGGQAVTDEVFERGRVGVTAKRAAGRGAADATYRILNTTPFLFAPLIGRIDYPRHSLTLIVKGTFQLRPGEPATLADDQAYPCGDEPYCGDDSGDGPPRYESDFAFFKPRGDVLLVGHCHAAGGQPVKRLPVELRVGTVGRSLEVCGVRFWQPNGSTVQASEPEPFTKLELRYEHSFGGPGYAANPVGLGHRGEVQVETDAPWPLPRIEDPRQPIQSPGAAAEAAGFGPEGKWYGRRRSQLGTYDLVWQQERWPWFPADFDWQYFNAAPRELQVDGFLRGDERLLLRHLHPIHAEYESRLPGVRVRCFVNPLGREFHEVAMQLDTLWVDADGERLVLVWRGHTTVASEECEDIRHVLILSQPMDEPDWPVADCHVRLLNELTLWEARFNPPPEEPPGEPDEGRSGASDPDVRAAESEEGESDRGFRTELEDLQRRIREAQVAAGVDPAVFDQQVRREQERLFREWGLDGDVSPAELAAKVDAELDRIQRQVRETQAASGNDPRQYAGFGAVPAGTVPAGTLPADGMPPESSPGGPADGGRWTRDRVAAHYAAGGDFVAQDLAGLDLSGMNLANADFRTAILAGCNLAGTSLQAARLDLANLAGASLTGADLRQAILDHADLTGAAMQRASLDQAQAHGTILSAAQLIEASLHRTDASGALLNDADLTAAKLSSALFDQANFIQARLDQADLRLSSLVEAELREVSALRARFDQADLTRVRAGRGDFTEASLQRVQAPDAVWEGACLDAANLSYARLPGANLIKASLERARLHAADLRGARLTKANLRQADLTDVNLFEADLRQADLTGGDVSRSNLYGAEVSQSNWTDTRREATNLKRTKMAGVDGGSGG
jgi:uncharacterized protein YjbI with pentapeptide repeats/pSer/pThr/pTyr-binding forkhead associated (FHA) protein